ncbi:MAG: TolC family protein [Bacteroidia bacterium]
MKFVTTLLLTLFFSVAAIAQNDSLLVFSFTEFLEFVKKNHPVAKQAKLLPEIGQAGVLNARGGFDPSAFTNIDQKYFDEKKYFSLINSGFKIPTWYGIELKGGYEQNQGAFLSPESSVPSQGLAYAGISIPIGQGLFIDERRAALKQAKIYAQATIAEQQLMLNELIYNAGKSYWDWFTAYNNLIVFEDALRAAQERFKAVKQSAILGDRPFVDTLESGIQVQDRMLNLQQAQLEYKNKSLFLSTFLWNENNVPLEMEQNIIPAEFNSIIINENEAESFITRIDSIRESHPAIAISTFKIQKLKIEKKWKTEKLKPLLNINYNALTAPVNSDVWSNYSINNYKWGLTFYMPLLLRKERGDLQLTKLKLTDAEYELQNKNLELVNKARASLNEHNISKQQIKLYSNTVNDYNALLAAEKRMFDSGESSLFMINAREMSSINARLKLIDLVTKNRKALLSVEYAFGELGLLD